MDLLASVLHPGTIGFGAAVVMAILGAIWLIGLIIVLHGSAPDERARIIAAYGRAFPWRSRSSPPEDGSKS